jgi:hypothetical protein
MTREQRLRGDWPQQRRFDRGQPERALDQQQARQDARNCRLGRQESGRRLFLLEVGLRDERVWKGGNRGQMDR